MIKRLVATTVLIYLWSTLAAAQSFAGADLEFPPSLKAIYHVGVKMRDGVELATDVYLPDGAGKFPTLLVRDMYSNGTTVNRQQYAKFATAIVMLSFFNR